ncbi:hypothetical protein [uncultured Sphingorhabdus sp.]|uniref:hypothetical protein n=1 Tax=uncultured Sphingorhabdus sp. TaxID=1686106 RepID=UPI0026280807|nr:hypothetical protein [uncultured Sphingorhabdus sp.]HMS21494.1 hypothetical protein [Sphingorhabdus sp.]
MNEERRLTLEEILDKEIEERRSVIDPLAHYVEVTPRSLAVLNLFNVKDHLERWRTEPLRLALAAKSAHLALQSALTDALAGSANIGAYEPKLQAAYLLYFEESPEGEVSPPKGDRIMSFPYLLAKAMEHPMEWSGCSLEVTDNELDALHKLTFVRHHVEHPRPQFHFIEPLFYCSDASRSG